MHHQHHQCPLTNTQCSNCPTFRRHHEGFEYASCREQQKEDSNVPGSQECPTVCYFAGDSEFNHVYMQNNDSCLTDSQSDFEKMCHQQEIHDVQMDPCFPVSDGRVHNPEVSLPQTSQVMNEEPEQVENNVCLCRAGQSSWNSNQWSSLPPPCCNVRTALVVGVEVDFLEEVIYEDTEIVQTQSMCDGRLDEVDSWYFSWDRNK